MNAKFSTLIPQETIDEIIKANEIVDVVSRYVKLSKKGKNYSGLCPFHSEKTPSFSVNADNQRFKCFGCGVGGNVLSFLMRITGNDFQTVCAELAEAAGIALQVSQMSSPPDEKQLERGKLYEAYELATELYQHILLNTEQGRVAREYLHERGFTQEMIARFRIGFAPDMQGIGRDVLVKVLKKRDFPLKLLSENGLIKFVPSINDYSDRFFGRVMFPIWNEKGQVIAFGGRLLPQPVTEGGEQGSEQPKYLNSQESDLFSKSRTLFGFHLSRADIKQTQTVVLFEGYVDLVRAWSAGVNNGVAVLGTGLTPTHVQILRRYADRAILCFDSDRAGQTATNRSIEVLEKANFRVKIALLPEADAKDPDEYIAKYGAASFHANVLDQAVTATRFRLQYARLKYRLHDEDDQLRYLKESMDLLADVTSPVEREMVMTELAQQFSLSLHTLKLELQEAVRRKAKRKAYDEQAANDDSLDRYSPLAGNGTSSGGLPLAFQRAERMLLALMMYSAKNTFYVLEKLGGMFHIEEHQALAAHIYSYYGNEPNASPQLFVFTLDDTLADVATSIQMEDIAATGYGENLVSVNELIREVQVYALRRELDELNEQLTRLERAGAEQTLKEQVSEKMIRLTLQLKNKKGVEL